MVLQSTLDLVGHQLRFKTDHVSDPHCTLATKFSFQSRERKCENNGESATSQIDHFSRNGIGRALPNEGGRGGGGGVYNDKKDNLDDEVWEERGGHPHTMSTKGGGGGVTEEQLIIL